MAEQLVIDHVTLHADEVHLAYTWWAHFRPDGATAAQLDHTGIPAVGVGDFERLERIAAWEKVIAWAQAKQCAEITGFVDDAEAAPASGVSAARAYESTTSRAPASRRCTAACRSAWCMRATTPR